MLSCEFWKISKNIFFKEHLRATASVTSETHSNFFRIFRAAIFRRSKKKYLLNFWKFPIIFELTSFKTSMNSSFIGKN